jgi:hypothetical protein
VSHGGLPGVMTIVAEEGCLLIGDHGHDRYVNVTNTEITKLVQRRAGEGKCRARQAQIVDPLVPEGTPTRIEDGHRLEQGVVEGVFCGTAKGLNDPASSQGDTETPSGSGTSEGIIMTHAPSHVHR